MVPIRHFRLVGARDIAVRIASHSSKANRTCTIVANGPGASARTKRKRRVGVAPEL